MQITKINYKLLLIVFLIVFIIGFIGRKLYLTKYPFIHNLDVPKKDYNIVAIKLNHIAEKHSITIEEAHNFIVNYIGYNGIDSTVQINTALNHCIRNGKINNIIAKQYFDSLKIANSIVFAKKVEEIYDKLKY